MSFKDYKLNILIIDNDASISQVLIKVLELFPAVNLTKACGYQSYQRELISDKFNTIIIDPFGIQLDDSSSLIFKIRIDYPKIVFALFTDFNNIKSNEFYLGERKRFKHYHKINKRTSILLIENEINSILLKIQRYLYGGSVNLENNENDRDDQYEMIVEVNELISENNVKKALKNSTNYFLKRNTDAYNELLILTQKWNELEKERNIGTIDISIASTIKAQILRGILEIINRKYDTINY